MLKKLKLENFRSYTTQEFDLDNNFIIIHAPNASGKTTILEAISVLLDGTSGWSSTLNDLYNQTTQEELSKYFRISADIILEEESKNHALYQTQTQKKFLVDNHSTTKRKFTQNTATTVFGPELIELLMVSPSKRREYIDRTIAKIDYDYADAITNMRKILRQRNAYLKKLAKRFYESGHIPEKDQQLNYWTESYTKVAGKIIVKRAQLINRLKSDEFVVKYEPAFEFNEFDLLRPPEEMSELLLKQMLEAKAQRRDIATGHTNIGPHRDDWTIITDREVKRFGSRGEKRMAIGKLIFLTQEILAEELGFYPVLLLDDISSELDVENTTRILTDEIMKKQQVFVTTVTLEGFPKKLLKNALIIEL